MTTDQPRASLPLTLDEDANSTSPGQPAFLSKPQGAPVYYGFPLIEETRIDGWCYGAITDFRHPDGCDHGDGFVEAPSGERAGLIWEVGEGEMSEVLPPEEGRWGV